MRKRLLTASIALATAALFGWSSSVNATTTSNWRPSTPPLPLEKGIEDWSVWGVTMSPDGRHVAALSGRPGQPPVVQVWDTTDLSKPPNTFGSREMRFVNVQFVKNDRLLLIASQPLAFGDNSNWTDKAVLTDLRGSEFIEPLAQGGTQTDLERDVGRFLRVSLYNRLANDPDHVLMNYANLEGATDVYRVNVRTGRGTRIYRGNDVENLGPADRNGNIVLKNELETRGGEWFVHTYHRPLGGDWRRIDALSENIARRSNFGFLRINAEGTKAWVVTDRNGDGHTNFSTIRELDLATGAMSEPIFQNAEYDATSVVFWNPGDEEGVNSDNIAGFCYAGPATECLYTHPTMQRIQARLERAFPNRWVNIIRVTDGGANVLYSVTSPSSPTTWYVLRNERQNVRLGSVLEGFDERNLGPGQWVTYPARDGLQIPGILFLPPGYDRDQHGRIPLVVLPHGGPWSRDSMAFDISMWPQLFATRGFAVLQPQYRGSDGLGRELWLAGDREWGAKMQDDKDDGAKWLVEQGVADPTRMMMYGYSYGGFAAAAAAARSGSASQGLWQCAISGAPVIDMDRLRINEWGANRVSRIVQGQTVRGWNPQAHLQDVQIPWLIFHGDYDRQADTAYSRAAAARMRAVNPNATFRYVEIPRMAHTLGEMTPDMRRQFIPLMFNWLDENCGNISTTFSDTEARNMMRQNERGSRRR